MYFDSKVVDDLQAHSKGRAIGVAAPSPSSKGRKYIYFPPQIRIFVPSNTDIYKPTSVKKLPSGPGRLKKNIIKWGAGGGGNFKLAPTSFSSPYGPDDSKRLSSQLTSLNVNLFCIG